MKPQIKILDVLFAHGTSLGCGDLGIQPTHFTWCRNRQRTANGNALDDIAFITENSFSQVDILPHKIKIGWLIETRTIHPEAYKTIEKPEIYNKFSFILTHDKRLLEMSDKFRFYPFGGCWIYPQDRKIYPKTKNISIIASKKADTEGHKLRHEVIKRFGSFIDGIYGRGYQELDYKLTGLKDYRYHIVIENYKGNYWFTEKLIDCFATGTIPIYWGMNSIGDFFDIHGMVRINNADHLQKLLTNNPYFFSDEYYQYRMRYIQKNLKTVQQYALPEDWIWENIIEPEFL